MRRYLCEIRRGCLFGLVLLLWPTPAAAQRDSVQRAFQVGIGLPIARALMAQLSIVTFGANNTRLPAQPADMFLARRVSQLPGIPTVGSNSIVLPAQRADIPRQTPAPPLPGIPTVGANNVTLPVLRTNMPPP